jgi:hypothetical protein
VNTPPDDPILELAKREPIKAPPPPAVPHMGREGFVLSAVGCGLGAAIAGPPGAVLGAGVGWCADAVWRRWKRGRP